MLDQFLANSTLQDIVHYMVIAVALVVLSPHGIFLLRFLLAALTGRPRPRIIRRRTALDAVSALERAARSRIEEATAQIAELQQMLVEVRSVAECLRAENDALKAHIRDMEQGSSGRAWADRGQAPPQESEASVRDYETLGLPGNPPPSWDQIRSAYRDAVKMHHPDQGGDPEIFRRINAAYARLRTAHGRG